MYLLPFLLLPLLPVLATLNGHCTGGSATGVWKENGICVKTSTCNAYNGQYKSGGCPDDPDDVKCCIVGYYPNEETNPCGKYSVCDWTANSCAGYRVDDKCPGGSNFKCCHF